MQFLSRILAGCWSVCKLGLVLGLLAAAVGFWFLYRQLDEEIRRQVETRFRHHYRELHVTVRSAQFIEGEGIQIRDITISDPRREDDSAQLLHVQELFVACDVKPTDLMSADLPVTTIHLRRPTLRLKRQEDGSWNAAELLPWPKFTECSPAVSIEDGTLEVIDVTKHPSSRLTMYGLNLTLAASEQGKCGPMEFTGQINADYVRRLEFNGTFDPTTRALVFNAGIEDMTLSDELRALLPLEGAQALAALGRLRGQVNADVQLCALPGQPLQFDLSGTLRHGSLIDDRFPYPLADIWATFRVRNDGFTVRDISARNGQTTIHGSCGRAGGIASGPFWIKTDVRRLVLDSHLFAALPEEAKETWGKFAPTGEVDFTLAAAHDGKAWKTDVQARLNGVGFSYHKLPYPIDRTEGTLAYKDGVLSFDLSAYPNPHERVPLHIHGRFQQPGPNFDGWLEVRGEQLTLDEKLMAALPERTRAAVQSLSPHGAVRFALQVWRSLDEPQSPLHQYLAIELKDCTLQYDRFPYPLRDVQGLVESRDGVWSFRDLRGANDTGQITCSGSLLPAEEGHRLSLDFTGIEVPLEAELRDALPPRMQRLWNDLKPRGAVNLAFHVNYTTHDKVFSLALEAQPIEESTSVEIRTFPYRLEKLRGNVSYADGRVTLDRLRGVHGAVTVSTNGNWHADANGNWMLQLRDLMVDHARLDAELMTALPPALRTLAGRLQIDGLLNLRGAIDLAGASVPNDPVRAAWDVEVDLQQGSLQAGLPWRNVNGGVRLVGTFDGKDAKCEGELDIDSLTWRNFQVTEVRGPVWVDSQRVLVGASVARYLEPRQPRSLVAKFSGGSLASDAAVRLDLSPAFNVQLRVQEPFDLARMTRESFPGRQNVGGKVSGFVNLQGTGSVHSLAGNGQLALREAQLYELPVMVAMLKLLSAKAPDPTAFTSADCQFRIDTGHVYFDAMNINGDAISLTGQGWMKPDLEVGLQFAALVGRDQFRVPILRDVVGGASKQLLQVSVTGPLDDATVRQDVLPGVNQALEQISRGLSPENPQGQGGGARPVFPLLPPPPAVAPAAALPGATRQ